jgi:glutamine cyclotransferase
MLFAFIPMNVIISCASEDEAEKLPPEIVENYVVEIIREIPHSQQSYTQGLLYHDGKLYESTGGYGESSLQRINPESGAVEKHLPIYDVFAEGLALHEDKLYQLTWQAGEAYVYDLNFERVNTFQYQTQGWGLTGEGDHLIMSDGSDNIYFRNPETFELERTISVTLENNPLFRLNELEYIDGYIFANVYKTNTIVKIDPETGVVVAQIDASSLWNHISVTPSTDVLNGIAYNPESDTYYLTGKNWDKLFEVEVVLSF